MFTGIVEELGEVVAVEDHQKHQEHQGHQEHQKHAHRVRLRASNVTVDAAIGGSIAVDGVCLTVTDVSGDADGQLSADVVAETLDRTSLGSLRPGSRVNLERPAKVGARLDGHVVQGHVDGVGWIAERDVGDVVRIGLPERLSRYVVQKGSIAVDGVSLTVVDVGSNGSGDWFTVALIPTTLVATTLGVKDVGDPVNLEVDVLAKYVERLVSP